MENKRIFAALFRFLDENRKTSSFLAWGSFIPMLGGGILLTLAIQYESILRQFGHIEWFWVYVGLMMAMSLALTPTTIIALISGYFMNSLGFLWVFFTYLVASCLGYWIAQRIDKGKFKESFAHPTANAIFAGIRQHELPVVMLCRISPIFPFPVMNILLANSGISFKNYLIGGMIGMLPRSVLTFWIGSQAYSIQQLQENQSTQLLSQIVIIVCVLISFSGLMYYFKKIIRSALSQTA